MTDDEKYTAIKLIDIDSTFERVCEKCTTVAEDEGCTWGSKECPFSGYFSEILDTLYKADMELQSLASSAESYYERLQEARYFGEFFTA